MITMEQRVSYLDEVMAELAIAQQQTKAALKELIAEGKERDQRREEEARRREEEARRREEEARLREEERRKIEEDNRCREEAYRRQAEEDFKSFQAELRAIEAEMRADTRQMKKTWGDLANKMGTVAEDVVAPNIPRLAVEEFGFSEVEDLMVRAHRASRRGEKRFAEFDVVCSGPGKVVMVEVKSTPTIDKVREVPVRMATFFDFFPEYEGRELIGVVASWAISPALLPAISEAGLFGIAMGEETMDVVARPANR